MNAIQNTARWLPCLMRLTTDDSAVTGLAYDDVTITYQKAGQAIDTLVIAEEDWVEGIEGGYQINFPAEVFDTLGLFAYWVSATGVAVQEQAIEVIGVGQVVGPGSTERTIKVQKTGGIALVGAGVWITSDEAGTDVVGGTLYTDDSGEVTFGVDIGTTYYIWCDSDEADFVNPTLWEAV